MTLSMLNSTETTFVNKCQFAKSKHSHSTAMFFVVIFSVATGLAVYAAGAFVESVNRAVFAILGAFVGFIVYKLQKEDTENDSYKGILFKESEFVVKFNFKPELIIRYDDVVGINSAFEGTPNSLIIGGDYPILLLTLHPLEKDMDEKFLSYLRRRILRSKGESDIGNP